MSPPVAAMCPPRSARRARAIVGHPELRLYDAGDGARLHTALAPH